MIRNIVLISLWTMVCLPALAETHYFLIDNSGSMSSHRDSAEDEISDAIRGFSRDDDVSIAYFRGISDRNCDRDVFIPAPTNAVENYTFGAQEIADGSTLLVRAINALYASAPVGEDALVTMFTDGSFRGESCDTPEDVCSVLSAFKTERPEIQFQLRAPRTVKELGIPQFRCAGLDEFPLIKRGAAVIAEVAAGEGEREGEEEQSGGDGKTELANECEGASLFWILYWMVGGLFCVNFLQVVLSRRLRFSRGINRRTANATNDATVPSKSSEDTSQEGKPPKKNLEWVTRSELVEGSITLAAVAVFFTVSYFYWTAATPARCWWWTLMNTPFGSLLFSTAIASFVGWWFYRFWDDSQNRRDQEWEVKLDSYKQEIADQRRSDRDSAMADILEKYDLDQAQLNSLAKDAIDEHRDTLRGETSKSLDSAAKLVDEVRAVILDRLPATAEHYQLKQYKNRSFYDEVALLSKLRKDTRITPEEENSLLEFFQIWKTVLKLDSDDQDTQLEKLNSFNKFTLSFVAEPID